MTTPNSNRPLSRIRIGVAVMLFFAACILIVFAEPNDVQKQQSGNCSAAFLDDWLKCQSYWPGSLTYKVCMDAANSHYEACCRAVPGGKCVEAKPIPDKYRRPGRVSPPPISNPTSTPRKGPGQVTPPPKSHPTATPRKGPGKVGGLPVGKSSPTPSPSGPVLLEKSGKPSPTPKPTPKKDHH